MHKRLEFHQVNSVSWCMHVWDCCFSYQLRLLFAREPSSNLVGFSAACTYPRSCSVCNVLYFSLWWGKHSYWLQFWVSSSTAEGHCWKWHCTDKPGQNPKLWFLTLLSNADLAMCLAKRPFLLSHSRPSNTLWAVALGKTHKTCACDFGEKQQKISLSPMKERTSQKRSHLHAT